MRLQPAFNAEVAQAREIGMMGWLEECRAIGDELNIGNVTTFKSDGSVEMRREDMLGHRKLQIETRLKIAAKLCPAKFGDKVALIGGSDTDAPIKGTVRIVEEVVVRHERLTE